jgi:RNA polymerase sigma-70 factor (ECF subfamily)
VTLARAAPFILAAVARTPDPANVTRVAAPSPADARSTAVAGDARASQASAEIAEQRQRERRLVERAHAGDRSAIGELLSAHGPTLYRSVLLPRLGSEAAAKDALSEVYARVVERIDRFTWQNVGFWPWLRTVGLHVALDQLRARKRLLLWEAEDVAREVDAAQSATPTDDKLSEHRDRQAARKKVEEALARIHPRYAHAIRVRVLEERSREEAARELGVTPSTFDVVLHRAMQAMRKALGTPATRDSSPPSSEAQNA